MNSEIEGLFRHMLKFVVSEVADEVLRARQRTEHALQSMKLDQGDALLLRASEVAKRLAISQRHLHKITAEGLLPCVRVGRLVRCSVETIKQWILDSQSAEPPKPRPETVADTPKMKVEKPNGVSKSKRKKPPKPTQAMPSDSKAPMNPTRESIKDLRLSEPASVEKSPNRFSSFLNEIGIARDYLGPLSNGELRRIAGVELPTFHGWMYLGREMPEEALENLRRHFRNTVDSTASSRSNPVPK